MANIVDAGGGEKKILGVPSVLKMENFNEKKQICVKMKIINMLRFFFILSRHRCSMTDGIMLRLDFILSVCKKSKQCKKRRKEKQVQ